MDSPIKIVVSGPVGAGKTTLVSALSEIQTVETEAKASSDIGKELTTIALDFGKLHCAGHDILLFGTPGQERFDFMWSILCEGATGLMLLVAANQPGSFLKARHILDHITSQVPMPFCVGVTHRDAQPAWDLEEIADFFQLEPDLFIEVDARDPKSGLRLLLKVLENSLSLSPKPAPGQV